MNDSITITEVPPADEPETSHIYARQNCRYCNEPISENAIVRHEIACATATPQLRETRRKARVEAYPRNKDVQQRRVKRNERDRETRRKLRELQNEHTLNGGVAPHQNETRLALTISCDFATLRKVMAQLAPFISLDKVEVK